MSVKAEIVPLEQERFARRSGERVGKTVAKVQARLMPAFAEVEKSLPSQVALFDGDGSTTRPARRRKASAWRMALGPSWLSTTIESSTWFATLIRQTSAAWMRSTKSRASGSP
jgi:broad specificity phosphatase PhoE